MKTNFWLITLAGMLAPVFAFCQTSQVTPKHIYSSVVGTNSEPVIYNALNLNTYELLTTNIQVSKENNLQKVVVAPFKLSTKTSEGIFRDTRINLAQKDGISTFGIGFGFDSSSPFRKKNDDILAGITMETDPIANPDEPSYLYEARIATIKRNNQLKYANAYKKMLEGSYKYTLGYNVSFFEVLGGSKIDMNKDGIIDNKYGNESHNFSAGFTYVFSIESAVNFTAHYNAKRGSAKGDEKRVGYAGGSLSFAHTIFKLDEDYEKSDDYLKSLFIPSIVLGFSLEYQQATINKSSAKNGITQTAALTPFVDFKINPKNQFRIGIPIKKYSGEKNETAFGPFLQWTLQLASQ